MILDAEEMASYTLHCYWRSTKLLTELRQESRERVLRTNDWVVQVLTLRQGCSRARLPQITQDETVVIAVVSKK